MAFLIKVPTSFSSIEKLAKKWLMAQTERHPPKEFGRARPIFKLNCRRFARLDMTREAKILNGKGPNNQDLKITEKKNTEVNELVLLGI